MRPADGDAVSNGLHGPFGKGTRMLRLRSSRKRAITLACLQFYVQSKKTANRRYGDGGGTTRAVTAGGASGHLPPCWPSFTDRPRSAAGELWEPPGSASETPRPPGRRRLAGSPGVESKSGSAPGHWDLGGGRSRGQVCTGRRRHAGHRPPRHRGEGRVREAYRDVEGGDHVEGGREDGAHGFHRRLVQTVVGGQNLAV